ncbi:MAG: Lrp/AsnC family transcriptional regulator [Candidatus Woesearchaeota archaeon]
MIPDSKDKAILKALTMNARLPVQDIAKKVRMPRDSVAYRIKRMEDKGIIKFYNPVVDQAKLGHPVFQFINISLRDFDAKRRTMFETHLKENPNVVYAVRMVGKYHYMVAVAAKDLPDFDIIFGKLFGTYADIIKEYDASSIIEEFKYDTYYDLITPRT